MKVNHAKGFGRASATICLYQSILSYKYRKIRRIVCSLAPIKQPPSGRLEGVDLLVEVKTPETILVGTLITRRLIGGGC